MDDSTKAVLRQLALTNPALEPGLRVQFPEAFVVELQPDRFYIDGTDRIHITTYSVEVGKTVLISKCLTQSPWNSAPHKHGYRPFSGEITICVSDGRRVSFHVNKAKGI